MYQPWTATNFRTVPELDRPVWVDLDTFWPPDEPITGPIADPVPGGLVKATGRVPGVLKRWARATDGRWFGRVDFTVTDAYGDVVAEHSRVLVPASALSPRD
jgi:hypothetical protein